MFILFNLSEVYQETVFCSTKCKYIPEATTTTCKRELFMTHAIYKIIILEIIIIISLAHK